MTNVTMGSTAAAGVVVGVGMAAPAVAGMTPALAEAMAPVLQAAAGATGAKAAGGATAGAISQGLQGNGPLQIVQGAAVGAVVSVVNPAGMINLNPGFWTGALNTGGANAANQFINWSASGTAPSGAALAVAFVGGGVFGGVVGPTLQSATQIIPFQAQLMSGTASGTVGGLVQGSVAHGLP